MRNLRSLTQKKFVHVVQRKLERWRSGKRELPVLCVCVQLCHKCTKSFATKNDHQLSVIVTVLPVENSLFSRSNRPINIVDLSIFFFNSHVEISYVFMHACHLSINIRGTHCIADIAIGTKEWRINWTFGINEKERKVLSEGRHRWEIFLKN